MKLIENGVVSYALIKFAQVCGLNVADDISPIALNKVLQKEWRKATEGTQRAQLEGPFPTKEELRLLGPLGAGATLISWGTKYEGTLLLGATLKAVARRVAFMLDQEQDEDWIPSPVYLLGSSRKLNDKQEMPEHVPAILEETGAEFDDQWQKDAATPNRWPRTELEMMERVLEWMGTAHRWKVVLVLAPDGVKQDGSPRPANTAETVKGFLTMASPSRYLVVSSQPFCNGQLMAVERAAKEAGVDGYSFDVCGPKAPPLPLVRWQDDLAKRFWEEVQLL